MENDSLVTILWSRWRIYLWPGQSWIVPCELRWHCDLLDFSDDIKQIHRWMTSEIQKWIDIFRRRTTTSFVHLYRELIFIHSLSWKFVLLLYSRSTQTKKEKRKIDKQPNWIGWKRRTINMARTEMCLFHVCQTDFICLSNLDNGLVEVFQ